MSTAASSMQDTARMIRDMESEFERNANARDAEAITAGYYAEDAQLLPPNAPIVKGKAAIREFWTAFLAAGSTDVKLHTEDVGASGDLAYSVGNYAHTMGGVRHVGKYTAVYRRQAGGDYKAIVDSFSDNS